MTRSKIIEVLKFHKDLLRDVRKVVNPEAYDIAMEDCKKAINEVEKLIQPCVWGHKVSVSHDAQWYDPIHSYVSCAGKDYVSVPLYCPDCGRSVNAETP